MAWVSLLLGLIVLKGQVSAQDRRCWRDTKCTGPAARSFEGPWSSNIYAPKSRTVPPQRVLDTKGKVVSSSFSSSAASLKGNGSTIVLDYGIEVGGIVQLEFTASGNTSIGLAFSESRNWIGQWSDSSNGRFRGPDGAIYADVTGASTKWTMPDKSHRGGFRYLTLFLKDPDNNNTSVKFSAVNVEIGFQPTWSDLTAYQGYFHSSDDQLNKIWYAGAYTLQTNCVPTKTGRYVPMLARGWANNATLGPGDTIIVDGAKRDRAVWPGDMGIAVPSSFFSTGDLDSVKNALQVMFDTQMKDGALYEAGPPLLQKNSDTYHMWTLIGTYNYILYSDDQDFLDKNWVKYQAAMDYITKKINSKGLLDVTGKRDWARLNQGGQNSEASLLMYQTLRTAARLASWKGGIASSTRTNFASRAQTVNTAVNSHLYDANVGAIRDSVERPALYPQDANSMAVLFGAVPADRARNISRALTKNWTPIGAETPELPGNISPFISSFEVQAHFTLGETARALDLVRRTWGWYLMHEAGTQSTMIEGYRTDGSFGYRSERGYSNDPSYVSHAHGWSTGPTSALTNFIAGIDISEPAGRRWSVRPQFGILQFAEAGFTTKLGRFRTKWEKVGKVGGYHIAIDTPAGTKGVVLLPNMSGKNVVTLVNGTAAQGKQLDNGLEVQLAGGIWNITVRSTDEPPPADPGWFGGLFGSSRK
ncbi:putative alpha-L-rhamnosidase B [Microthyrium microscopicum]|uniref:Putative alpha-L-rhamnosidase B n=1 Tax=Microthyrium microscopicum TaxID=703497 RepID=A0A6A6UFQ0_9PEZI|nr:putative alpha-L-rhamnosidase B [Microthyrium microscopicum]